jgi:signal transduction histidine kinase
VIEEAPRQAARNAAFDVVSWRTWAATGYLMASFAVGLFWFVFTVTALAVGSSLVVLWVGLPILALTMLCWKGGARAERAFIRTALDVDIPSPYRPIPDGSILRRWRARAGDPATWRDGGYLLLLGPLGTIWFVLATTLWSIPFSLLSVPLWYRTVPGGARLFEFSGRPLIVVDSLPKALLLAVAGLVLAVVVPPLIRGIGAAHAAIARRLLGPSAGADLVAQVEEARARRTMAVDVAATERRRIERDLHDGAQQRLVALAMDLGMAREKFAKDPEQARALLDEAHDEAKRALSELRDLARGIHPAVLTDRGLDAALSALAGRSAVPVEVSVALPRRPPPAVESAAYFVVAEALVNVARHAAASRAEVRVTLQDQRLVVEVSDDGVGGADPRAGSGLAGLADRVTAVDGRFSVSSPAGGPTVIRAELPCEW